MGSRFFRGFAALFRALPLAFEDKKLRLLTIAPAIVTLLLSIAAAAAAWHWGHLLVERYQTGHGWLYATFLWIVLVLAVGAAAWLGWLLAGVVATAPFADSLAERSEELAGAAALPKQKVLASAAQTVRGVGHTLLSVILYAAITVPLFFVQLVVPPLSPVVAAIGVVLTAQFLAYDLFDPCLSRRGRNFGEKWQYLKQHRPEALGLGVAAALGCAVPLLSVLVIPVATVAAAQLFAQMEKPLA